MAYTTVFSYFWVSIKVFGKAYRLWWHIFTSLHVDDDPGWPEWQEMVWVVSIEEMFWGHLSSSGLISSLGVIFRTKMSMIASVITYLWLLTSPLQWLDDPLYCLSSYCLAFYFPLTFPAFVLSFFKALRYQSMWTSCTTIDYQQEF